MPGPAELPVFARKTLLGYASAMSVAPGQTLRFMVSSENGSDYDADLVRIFSGDLHPQGSGFTLDQCEADFAGRQDGRLQPLETGSFAWWPADPRLLCESFTAALLLWPTTPGKGRQVLMTHGDANGAGWMLALDADGAAELSLADGQGGHVTLASSRPLRARCWYRLAASYDAASGSMRLWQEPLAAGDRNAVQVVKRSEVAPAAAADAPLMLAARRAGDHNGRPLARGFFNGKLEAPRLARRALTRGEIERLLQPVPDRALRSEVLVAADFSRDIDGVRVFDAGPLALHGRIENLPTRAVTGHCWDGSEHCWRHAPAQYAAIHFHDDDLYDAGWQSDFKWQVPAGTDSGVYAARLRALDGDETEYIPFVVRPPRGAASAPVALLLPTASYMAYANEHAALHHAATEVLSGHLSALKPEDVFLQEHPEYGLSLYDTHSDGSGVSISSRLRPILNLRPGYTNSWIGAGGSAPWQFNADLHIVAWLHAIGQDVDVISDEDLHTEGVELLSHYRVLITGTHPEYHSTPMLDAIETWLHGGGRLMYLGGNGFYWRVAFHRQLPGVIELRRAEDGIRDWVAEPGEYHHAFSGEYGGMWRRLGRPPQRLVGVGMAVQGFDLCGHFERTEQGRDPRAAFVFEGVQGDVIGDYGVVGGGAAGLELDRHDEALGSPPGCIVLARSANLTPLYFPGPEEVDNVTGSLAAPDNPMARGDMVFFSNAAGGAVFSASSISWAGSLGWNGGDNDVARITGNVLRRFLERAAFEQEPPASGIY